MESAQYDLIVIGGGAAGFFAAITAAERNPEIRILILEKGREVLQKVRISGGGRCNVTHDQPDVREFATNYPRGAKSLMGPLHRWGQFDTVAWFESRGVALKTEADGRMFPITDRSQTVIDCFLKEAERNGIEIRCKCEVESVGFCNVRDQFSILTSEGKTLEAKKVLVASGGIRNQTGSRLARGFGHAVAGAAPSLFTFCISNDAILEDLAGVSVPTAKVTIPDISIKEAGPVLITHWGLSGPAILRASARGARELQEVGYQFIVEIAWGGGIISHELLQTIRQEEGGREVASRGRFGIPARLWKRLIEATGISAPTKWSQLQKSQAGVLLDQINRCRFQVSGKSLNKDEFVTCGGVSLKEIDLKTMESRLQKGLYFAGEVIDIDGITGGFNFQSAWTTGYLAGTAIGGTIR